MTATELAKRLEDKDAEQGKSGSKRFWRGFRLASQREPESPERDTRDAWTSVPPNFSTRDGDETLPGTRVPDVPDVPNDVLDRDEYEAEHAWRNQQ
jgi:hypothetical protein